MVFFNYSKYFKKISVGDFLELRLQLNQKGIENFYKVLTAEKTTIFPSEEIFKSFKGTLKVIEGKGFGFIDNIFVPPYLINQNNLTEKNGLDFEGYAILNFNKKKGIWDWKIISIKEE